MVAVVVCRGGGLTAEGGMAWRRLLGKGGDLVSESGSAWRL